MKNFILMLLISLTLSNGFSQEQLLKQLNSIKKTWQSGYNKYFQGMSFSEIKSLMGTLQTPIQDKLPQKQIKILSNLPDSFDSRDYWSNCQSIKQVRDQSSCGSCWAFATVQTISDRICIGNGQRLQTRISSQNLLSCCGIQCGRGCDGGSPHQAWKYYEKTGIVTGWLYNTKQWCQSYSFAPCDHHTQGKYGPCGKLEHTPKCQKKCSPQYKKQYSADHNFGKLVYSVPSKVDQIRSQIITNGPVQASFIVHNDFLTYKSGVYHHVSGSALGGHSVKIIGWGVENQVPYWLVTNSWNQDWGDKGFFKIKRGSDQCGIQKQVLAGIPKIMNQNLKTQ